MTGISTVSAAWRASRPSARAILAWLATRTIGICFLVGVLPYSQGFARINGDVRLYESWSHAMLNGAVPYHDFGLMYPPGVIPLLALPHSSANMYVGEYIALALLADFLCLWLLSRRGQLGAWLWVIAVPLLGPVSWGRLDIFVALALIVGVTALDEARPVLAGACFAYAGLVKLWPLGLLLLFLPLLKSKERLRFFTAGAGVVAVFVVPLLALGAAQGLWSSVTFEKHRGVELESLPAVPLHIAQVLGVSWHTDLTFGSLDVVTSQSGIIRLVSEVALISGWLLLAAWVIRARRLLSPTSCLLLLVALTLVTNRVLSPQYMLWLAAAVALYLDSAADPQRLGVYTCAAMISTQALFPFLFASLAAGTAKGLMGAILHAGLLLAVGALALTETYRKSKGSDALLVPPIESRPDNEHQGALNSASQFGGVMTVNVQALDI